MDYDPLKNRLGDFVADRPLLTRVFYTLLQLFFLRAWYVRRELKRQIPVLAKGRELRMLDAGTGFGQFSYYLAKKYSRITIEAVDVKETYLERARRFFETQNLNDRVSFKRDDLTKLEAQGPFDLILSVDVMEHIEDDEGVFRNFKKVLAPGGVVIINTPSDKGGSDVAGPDDENFIGEHVRDGYSPEMLAWKLSMAGLEATRSIYTYGPAGSLAWRILIKIPMMLVEWSRVFLLLLPFYYVFFLPIGVVLNLVDMFGDNASGTGILVIAEHR